MNAGVGGGGNAALQFARARLARAAALGVIPANYNQLDHGNAMAGFHRFNPAYAHAVDSGQLQQVQHAATQSLAAPFHPRPIPAPFNPQPVPAPIAHEANTTGPPQALRAQMIAAMLAAQQAHSGGGMGVGHGPIESGHLIPNRNGVGMQASQLATLPGYPLKGRPATGPAANNARIRQLAQRIAAGNTQSAPYTYDALGPNPISNMFQANSAVSY